MWLYCRAGFFSVVQHKSAPNLLLVRARDAEDLNELRDMYMSHLGKTVETLTADYPYRAVITKKHYSKGMVKISYDIDYTNFKTMTSKELGSDRASVYHKVHSATMGIDTRKDHWSRRSYSPAPYSSSTPSTPTRWSPVSPYAVSTATKEHHSVGFKYENANFKYENTEEGSVTTRINPDTGDKTITRFPKGGGKPTVEVIKAEVRKPGDSGIIENEVDAAGNVIIRETDANGKLLPMVDEADVISDNDDAAYERLWNTLRDRADTQADLND